MDICQYKISRQRLVEGGRDEEEEPRGFLGSESMYMNDATG